MISYNIDILLTFDELIVYMTKKNEYIWVITLL